MYTQGQGDWRIGSPWRGKGTEGGSRRVGWWGLGPLLYGLIFLLVGVAMLVGSGAAGPGGSGLVISGIVFVVIGAIALAVAWYIRRDIKSDDAPARVPGDTAASLDAELRVTGVPGSAVIKGFKFMTGSSYQGSTLVELELELSTTLGGTIPLEHQTRVPLALADKLAVGATVPVLVSSTDPSKLIVEWTGFVAAPATPPAATPPAPTQGP